VPRRLLQDRAREAARIVMPVRRYAPRLA